MIAIILLVSIARVLEAYRDAEAFERAIEIRSLKWHLFKFLQYGFWFIAGGIWFHNWIESGHNLAYVFFLLGVVTTIAFIIFEKSLEYFRAKFREEDDDDEKMF